MLANIIILAHAVIPHHHHDGFTVLFSENHSKNNDVENHNHNHSSQHNSTPHEHDCGGDTEKCILKEIYTRPISYVSEVLIPIKNLAHNILFSTNSIIYDFCYQYRFYIPYRHKPYLLSYNSILLSKSIGSRAPPIC